MSQANTADIIPFSMFDLQCENVLYELDSIERMYLNCYVPNLTSTAGVVSFFRDYRGRRFVSAKVVALTERFTKWIFNFVEDLDIPTLRFAKGQRKAQDM